MTATVDTDHVIDLRDPAPGRAPARERVVALDAVRGLAIVVMLLAVHPGPRDGLVEQLKHPEWHGVHFADLFFPLFLFAIGGAMPFSGSASTPTRVLRRAGILFVLGIALQAVRHGELLLSGVLQHIAVAYVLAWLVLRAPARVQPVLCAAALAAYGAAFVLLAGGDDPWGPDRGFAHTVNGWFFDGFRTEGVPQSAISAVNVVVGAWALRGGRPDLRRLWAWAAAATVAGLALAPLVPLNKHLWTPSFALLTAGTSLAFFAALHVLERRGRKLRPLVHLGCNAIAVYVLFIGIGGAITRHRGPLDSVLEPLPDAVVANGWALVWLLLGWVFARALYRRRLFLKI